MWFEDLMLLVLLASGIFLIGIPAFKFAKLVIPRKRDALAEAKERLERARIDLEAAKVNKEADKLYEDLYEEALQDEEQIQQEKHK
jgi:biopolymer transport protein ExbB/TolQ